MLMRAAGFFEVDGEVEKWLQDILSVIILRTVREVKYHIELYGH